MSNIGGRPTQKELAKFASGKAVAKQLRQQLRKQKKQQAAQVTGVPPWIR